MPFDYYRRLNKRQRSQYDASDRIDRIAVPQSAVLRHHVEGLQQALQSEQRRATERSLQTLSDALVEQLGLPPLQVRVLAARPSEDWGELQGLYEGSDGSDRARVTVWMRTAKKRQVVRFRTFLRTYLHELCHHVDFTALKLGESFHTEGFFKRESSLMAQLVGPAPARAARERALGSKGRA